MNRNILILAAIIAGIIIVGIDFKTGAFVYKQATVEAIEIMELESFPVQIIVNATGYLPDGCTSIHNIKKGKDGDKFLVTITTSRRADAICTQVIVPFNEVIPLDVYGLKAGKYEVDVNGVKGTFGLNIDNILNLDES